MKQPPDVLGLELGAAMARLRDAGFVVTASEVRSRGGVAGSERRVIRQRCAEDGAIALCYSVFKTDIDHQNATDKAEQV